MPKNMNNRKNKKSLKKKKKTTQMIRSPPMNLTVSRNFRPPQANHAKLMSHCVGLCNPFSIQANGCQYPDGMSGVSFPYTARINIDLQVDSQGNGNCIFTPTMPTNFAYSNNQNNSGGQNWWDYTGANYGSVDPKLYQWLVGDGAFYRINCAGVIIRCTQNAMVAQGQLIVSKTTFPFSLGTTQWPVGSLTAADVRILPVVAGAEYTVLHSPIGAGARQFIGYTSTSSLPYWDSIVIEAVATVPSTLPITIECIYHVEVAPTAFDQSLKSFAPTQPEFNPTVTAIVNKVASAGSNIFNGGVKALGDALKNRIFQAIAGRVNPALGVALPMIVD